MDSPKSRLPADLKTQRLALTTPILAHVPEMAVLANNARIHQVMARLPYPYNEGHGHTFVEAIARGPEDFAWAILHGGRFIGVIGLHFLPAQLPELGYWLGEPHWGKGYATEAGQAVVAAAHEAGFSALRSRALSANARSRRVLSKLGFLETGVGLEPTGPNAGQPVTFMHLDLGTTAQGPRLLTRRLVLRLPEPRDADAMVSSLNDFAVAGNLARVPYPYGREDANAFIAARPKMPDRDQTSFVIDLAGAGMIGMVGFHGRPEDTVVGYWLGRPYWGRGIMTEAVSAALDWFFEDASVQRVLSGVFHFNAPSLAIQKKLGFTETGTSSVLCLARREHVRHIDTELTRAVWVGRRAP